MKTRVVVIGRVAVSSVAIGFALCRPAGAQTEAWRARGVASEPQIGDSVAWLADVNGDGVPDYVAGGPSIPTFGSGHALVASGADGSILLDLAGAPGTAFGCSVARSCDLDGDGIDDVAVGALLKGNGAVYIYSGATGALSRTLTGPSFGSGFGTSLADLGDVDGDGVRDLAIGAPEDTSGGSRLGLVEIVSGASGAVIATWTGAAVNGQFGSVVADAGDFDGDGRDDLIVVEQDVAGSGQLTIFSSATFQPLRQWNLGAWPAAWTAAGTGDVNGDGIPDVIVGNPQYPVTFDHSTFTYDYGGVWVYDGATGSEIRTHAKVARIGSSVSGAGDVDGDGFSDYAFYSFSNSENVEIHSGLNGSLLAVSGAQSGVVAGGMDTNGDGVPDLLVGMPQASANGPSSGMVVVLDPVSWLWLVKTPGATRVDNLGRASALLDDVNGDGTRDVLVGEGRDSSGSARVLSGMDGSELRVHSGPSGSSGQFYGWRVASLPDVDGDAIGEYAITDPDLGQEDVEIRSGASGSLLKSLTTSGSGGGSDSFGASCAAAIQPSGAVQLAVGNPNFTNPTVTVFDVGTGNIVVSFTSILMTGFTGTSASHLGDVDGDGIGDWVAGEPGILGNYGDVVVFSGQSGNVIQTISSVTSSGFGSATAGPGDLDGDGVPDLLVGAPDEGTTLDGAVYLYSGATWTLSRSWTGSAWQQLGSSLTVVGDVNRDGFNDFVVGQEWAAPVHSSGTAYLCSGGSGALLHAFDGAAEGDSFGATIAGVAAPGSSGSLNGDSIPDVAIGAEHDATNGVGAGRLSLYFLDDLYLQISPPSATAGQSVSINTSGGPAGALTGLFAVGFDSTPTFQPVSIGTLASDGIWTLTGAVPPGLSGHSITFRSYAIGFSGKLVDSTEMELMLQ